MSRLRVLQVLPELQMGGVERATLDMVAALRKQFPETYVASQGGSLVSELNHLGGIHITLPLASKNPLTIFSNARALAQLVRAYNIQVIHARSRAPGLSALLAARWTRIPFVTTYHGAYRSTNFLKAFYNSIMARGDGVIAISEFIAHHIHHHYPSYSKRVHLIHEGINVQEFSPTTVSNTEIKTLRTSWGATDETIIFLLPGRISRIKGQAIFIEAIKHLKNKHILGVILGHEEHKSSFLKELEKLSEGLPIRFVPYTPNPKAAYAAANFIVCPSLAPEAFGRITAEAGAMERVVITTNHGATTELCQSGKTGFLIPPNDSMALVGIMQQALEMSPHHYQTIGKAARAHICQNFSLERMCDETINLYKELSQ